jgi:hypothetical protein
MRERERERDKEKIVCKKIEVFGRKTLELEF